MKTKLILVCALILLVFSCSSAQKAAAKEQLNEGAKLFNEQKYTEAIAVFEKVLEKDPKNTNALYNIAISYIQLKDDDKALIYLDKTTEISPFYKDAWYNKAVLFFKKENYSAALEAALNSESDSERIKMEVLLKLSQQGIKTLVMHKQAVIMGALSRKTIYELVDKFNDDYKKCYETGLKKDSTFRGNITVNFVVSGEGKVLNPKVQKTTMNNENVETCVVDIIKKIKFPAPKGGGIVIVNYPFVFINNADTSYNAANHYLRFKDKNKALEFFKKVPQESPYFMDAWYHIASIEYENENFIEAVSASFKGYGAEYIREKSYEKLKETGFLYKSSVQMKSNPVFSIPNISSSLISQKIKFALYTSKDGIVEQVSCKNEENKELCEYFDPIVKKFEFIPAYDFDKKETVSSMIMGEITINDKQGEWKQISSFDHLIYNRKALEENLKNANEAYDTAISYIQFKDEDNALIYLKKAIDINKLYYDAWHNIALINYNKGDYKEAVKNGLKSGDSGKEILEKSFVKLKEAGFPNRDYSQIIENYSMPQNDFVIEANEKNIYFTLLISKDGKIEKVSCGKEKKIIGKLQQTQPVEQEKQDLKEKEICDFYVPFLSSLEFIPAYDFSKNELKNSEEIGFITLNKDKNNGPKLAIINGIEVTTSDKKIKSGTIDKSVIDAYVQRNLAKIRWCYEKELIKNRNLGGRIVFNFIIGEDGSVPVAKVSRTTMNNENVERCVADQIKKIKFPSPKGGGIVIVNYPFVFKHSEG